MANVSLAGMAMEVFVPSWGEINVSLAATLIFIILVTYLQQRFTVDDKSMECSDGEGLQLPGISELESVALSSPTVQAVAKVNITLQCTPLKSLAGSNYILRYKKSSTL